MQTPHPYVGISVYSEGEETPNSFSDVFKALISKNVRQPIDEDSSALSYGLISAAATETHIFPNIIN